MARPRSPPKHHPCIHASTLFAPTFAPRSYAYFVPNYLASYSYTGKVARVLLDDFSTVAVLDMAQIDDGLRGFIGGFSDGKYGYLVPHSGNPQTMVKSGKVARFNVMPHAINMMASSP